MADFLLDKVAAQPALMFVIAMVVGLSSADMTKAVLLVAFPGSAVAAMIATNFESQEAETASAFVISAVLSIISLSEPLAFAPLASIILVLFGLQIPELPQKMLDMLGDTTSGIALFAVGVTVGIRKIKFSMPALSIALLFMGIPVLGSLFGMQEVAIPIAITGIVVNAMLDPLAIIVGTVGRSSKKQTETTDSIWKVTGKSILHGLPAHFVSSILSTPKDKFYSQIPLMISLVIGIVGFYVIILLLLRFLFKYDLTDASMFSLNSAQPTFATAFISRR
ncbi:hypothetical protein DT075_07705 [Bacillus licheniformis]|nr:hypothetical protein DT075_07705 [Bacillus licheniformis]